MPGQESGHLVGQDLGRLADAGVGHRRQVDLLLLAPLVDDEQRRGVIDLAGLDLHVDVVGLPDGVQLGWRPGQEVPLVHHGVRARVGHHVGHRGGVGVRVDAQQLHVLAGPAEQLLGLHHAHRGERADRGALGVGEGQDHDLAAERAERDLLAELIGQPEVGRCGAAERGTRIQIGVGLGGVLLSHGRHPGVTGRSRAARGQCGQCRQHRKRLPHPSPESAVHRRHLSTTTPAVRRWAPLSRRPSVWWVPSCS